MSGQADRAHELTRLTRVFHGQYALSGAFRGDKGHDTPPRPYRIQCPTRNRGWFSRWRCIIGFKLSVGGHLPATTSKPNRGLEILKTTGIPDACCCPDLPSVAGVQAQPIGREPPRSGNRRKMAVPQVRVGVPLTQKPAVGWGLVHGLDHDHQLAAM